MINTHIYIDTYYKGKWLYRGRVVVHQKKKKLTLSKHFRANPLGLRVGGRRYI